MVQSSGTYTLVNLQSTGAYFILYTIAVILKIKISKVTTFKFFLASVVARLIDQSAQLRIHCKSPYKHLRIVMYGSGEGNQESFGQLIASLLLSIFESNDKQTINLFQENLKYVYSSGRHLDFAVLAISVSNKSTSLGIFINMPAKPY